MTIPREIIVTVDGDDSITGELFGFDGRCKSIDYRDNMGVISDTMNLSLYNAPLSFLESFPDGAEIQAQFTHLDGRILETGKMYVETHSGGVGANTTLSVGCNSQPNKDFGLETFVSWTKKRTDLRVLLTDIIEKQCGLTLDYKFEKSAGIPWSVGLKNVTINNEVAGEVVKRYADDFGCMLKIIGDTVFFGNKIAFSQEPVIKVINPVDVSLENFTFDLNFYNASEYTVSYYNPRTGKTTSDRKNKKSVLMSESGTLKRIVGMLADASTAEALASAIDGQTQCTISFGSEGDPDYIAGGVLELEEMLKLSGKYVIASAQHTFDSEWRVDISGENIF